MCVHLCLTGLLWYLLYIYTWTLKDMRIIIVVAVAVRCRRLLQSINQSILFASQ